MSEIKDGGPACSRCGDPAVRKQGHQHLCAKHYRFGQMRSRAKRDGKTAPTHEQLHTMPGSNLTCPDCTRRMNWLSAEGKSTVASLQHYRDGTLAIVCLSCNTRHASMDGDSYRDMPKDHKRCGKCREIKPATEYTKDLSRSGDLQRKSTCKTCSDKAANQWKDSNRDRYNEYQRQYRAKRKAEGNPVRRGS
jgi:hypothetical protein